MWQRLPRHPFHIIKKIDIMTQRSYLTLALTTLLLLAFTSCSCSGNKKKTEPAKQEEKVRMVAEAEVNPEIERLEQTPDDSFMATLQEVEDDSLVLRSNETGEILALSYRQAAEERKLKGSLTVGNDFNILCNLQQHILKTGTNVSQLEGQWFYDMQQHRGLTFDHRGAISSINADNIVFRQWKILNGEFYLYYLTPDMIASDKNEYLLERAEIKELNNNHLQFIFFGKTYDCQRQRKAIKLGS